MAPCRAVALAAVVGLAAGCSCSAEMDAGTDGGVTDAGPSDSGTPDAGPMDSGVPDAGPSDSGTPDAGPADAGPVDSGLPDAGVCPTGGPCDDGNACTVADTCNDAGTCVGGATRSCDDSNVCTADSCDPAHGCVNVDVSRCGGPNCMLAECAGVDTDGDGFPDVVEDADFIDLNCNGVHDSADFDFPHRQQPQLSTVTRTGTGTTQILPTVTDSSAAISPLSVVVTVTAGGDWGAAQITWTIDGGMPSAPVEARPVVDLGSNVRVLFYDDLGGDIALVAGDTYAFTTSMGADEKIADKTRPNIYIQYDSMNFATPGMPCTTSADCDASGTQMNDVCHQGHCNHDHAPIDPLFRWVVDAFGRHGTTLYVDPVHYAVPHATVLTFAAGGTPGGQRGCAGFDVDAGDITTGGAVSFFDVKRRTGWGGPFDPKRAGVFHYSVFGHLSSCVSDSPGNGDCQTCPTDRATPPGLPFEGQSGTAELPGNDFIISLGSGLNTVAGSSVDDPFIEAGTLMHELGHNLGLHHAGELGLPTKAANYLSVMNYQYQTRGIHHAATPGSIVVAPALREVNYSEHALTPLTECSLNEADGVSPADSGYTGIISFCNVQLCGPGPESGPIDWDGNGVIDSAPVCVDLNQQDGIMESSPGYRDWDHPAVDGGVCAASSDCRVNFIRNLIHNTGGPGGNPDPLVSPNEPCVRGVCQSLFWAFQCAPWSAD